MKKILVIIVLILIGIQFITIDKTNPTADMSKDFIKLTNPPQKIGELIKSSCYDCHSFHTKYPWYSDIAPMSWLIKEHINDGRRHLNFSIWTEYKEKKKDTKLGECIDMVRTGEMPMKGYLMLHDEAELSEEQRQKFVMWLRSIRN